MSKTRRITKKTKGRKTKKRKKKQSDVHEEEIVDDDSSSDEKSDNEIVPDALHGSGTNDERDGDDDGVDERVEDLKVMIELIIKELKMMRHLQRIETELKRSRLVRKRINVDHISKNIRKSNRLKKVIQIFAY